MTAYNQRGGAEVEQFRQDKQGLALAARRKASLNGRSVRPVDRLGSQSADSLQPPCSGESRFRAFGLKRIVRANSHSRRTPF